METQHLVPVLETIKKVAASLETVISVGVASRCEADGRIPHAAICENAEFSLFPNGKTNLGLGRPAGTDQE